MVNRRVFFKHAGVYAAGTLLLPACASKENNAQTENESTPAQTTAASGQSLGPIGLQLYSVKDVIDGDLQGTLQLLTEVGALR